MGALRLAIWTIVLAGLVPAAAAWSQDGTGMVNCGRGVRALIVDCGKAKRLAAEFRKTKRRSIWMYTCSAGGSRGRCILDRKVVTFPLE